MERRGEGQVNSAIDIFSDSAVEPSFDLSFMLESARLPEFIYPCSGSLHDSVHDLLRDARALRQRRDSELQLLREDHKVDLHHVLLHRLLLLHH